MARARGREPSMTTSAVSSRRPSSAAPSAVEKGSATERWPWCKRAKSCGSPVRAASGRSGSSTFTTSAPASDRRCAQSGPAHIADRSTTCGRRRAGPVEGPSRLTRHGALGAGRRPGTGEAGSPRSWARAATTDAGIPAAHAETRAHSGSVPAGRGGASARSGPTRAGTDARSDGRARVRATHPSEVRNIRQRPPADTRPPGASPRQAARSVRRAATRHRAASGVFGARAHRTRPAASSRPTTSPAGQRGAEPGWPVSHIEPEPAQRSTAQDPSAVGRYPPAAEPPGPRPAANGRARPRRRARRHDGGAVAASMGPPWRRG